MNFDKIVTGILEMHSSSQAYRKARGADYDQDVENYGGNDDTKSYWEITKSDGTKYYMTKEPKFKNENVRGPFRGRPPKQ